MPRFTPVSTLFPYTTLFRSAWLFDRGKGGNQSLSPGGVVKSDQSHLIRNGDLSAVELLDTAKGHQVVGREDCRRRIFQGQQLPGRIPATLFDIISVGDQCVITPRSEERRVGKEGRYQES